MARYLRGASLNVAQLQGADLQRTALWRATIGDEPERDDLWRLADLRGADVAPIKDADALTHLGQ